MWFDDDEEKYLDSKKKANHYHFSIPFTYIKKRLGNNQYEDGTAVMEVDVNWDQSQHGYVITYHCPDSYLIDPAEGNGTIDDFWHETVYFDVMDKLESLDIYATAICII
jgi:hypothetical protein